jgi:pimeloyl-ACP methyl ester carboxylesterase
VRLVYLHGFASGPGSTKAQWLRARLAAAGHALAVPDLAPDFERMTVASMLAVAEAAVDDGPALVFGSSLGGWLATLLAARRPAAVRGLALFAPAFGFVARWAARLGPDAMAAWRRAGTLEVFHYGLDRPARLDVGFLDDAARWPAMPDPSCAALVHAGRHDDTVPLDAIAPFVAARPARELVVWDSGHELVDVLAPMWARTAPFLRAGGVGV